MCGIEYTLAVTYTDPLPGYARTPRPGGGLELRAVGGEPATRRPMQDALGGGIRLRAHARETNIAVPPETARIPGAHADGAAGHCARARADGAAGRRGSGRARGRCRRHTAPGRAHAEVDVVVPRMSAACSRREQERREPCGDEQRLVDHLAPGEAQHAVAARLQRGVARVVTDPQPLPWALQPSVSTTSLRSCQTKSTVCDPIRWLTSGRGRPAAPTSTRKRRSSADRVGAPSSGSRRPALMSSSVVTRRRYKASVQRRSWPGSVFRSRSVWSGVVVVRPSWRRVRVVMAVWTTRFGRVLGLRVVSVMSTDCGIDGIRP